MRQILRGLRSCTALALVVLALAACAGNRLAVSTTRFHDPDGPGDLAGLSADVIPARPELAKDPRFTDFGDRLGRRLAALGLRPAGGGQAAIHARLDYATVAREERASGPTIGVGIGAGHAGGHVGVGGSVGIPITTGGRRAVYDHRVTVALIRAEDGHVLWEGRALVSGTKQPLAQAYDAMLAALFADFPGANGQTTQRRVPLTPAQAG